MKSIKRALCSVLVCFGAFMFCTGTANAAEGAEAVVAESADNNFVDNSVTDNLATNEVVVSQNVDVNAVNLLGGNAEAAGLVQNDNGSFVQVAEQQMQLTEQQVTVQETTENADEEVSEESEKPKKSKKNKKAKKKYTKAELRLMASLIYCESNGQPYAGKLAVGIVVMNRVKAKAFPNTIKGVIYQRSQFSPAHNGTLKRALARYDAGKFNSKNEKQCIKAAKEALEGVKVVKISGSKKNMKSYHYFSGSLRGARMRISGHQFK